MRSSEFKGWDVFDGLNSKVFHKLKLYQFPIVRLLWIQFFKRSPINFRPIMGVPKKQNPKGIGLVILGLIENYKRTLNEQFLNEAIDLGNWLLSHRAKTSETEYYCWGYHFPWEARAFHVPLGKANIISTSYIARALWSIYNVGGGEKFNDAACRAGLFIANNLYIEKDNRCYFSYIPGEDAFVHNASLWGAAIVAETGRILNSSELLGMAFKVCEQSLLEQNLDGSWVYGVRKHHNFIDGFHTGYNLEALDMSRRSLLTNKFDSAIENGMNFYRENFFLGNGMPKYYTHNAYPIDMHSVSQAVLTLLKVGKTEDDLILAKKVVSWSLDNMYIKKTGNFSYQITRFYRNNICYMRWTQAWSYYSLSFLLRKMIEFSLYEKNKYEK